MITLPYYLLLILYTLFLLVFFAFAFLNLRHLTATGSYSIMSLTATVLFALFSLVVIVSTFILLASVQWSDTVAVWNPSWLLR